MAACIGVVMFDSTLAISVESVPIATDPALIWLQIVVTCGEAGVAHFSCVNILSNAVCASFNLSFPVVMPDWIKRRLDMLLLRSK